MAKILLVEDDATMAAVVEACLEGDRHFIDWAETIEAARSLVEANEYDLYILDWNLPDGTGMDFCRMERDHGRCLPVLMLTAKAASVDKVEALDGGADDYLTKPFDTIELGARVRALLRRPTSRTAVSIDIGGVELNTETLEVRRDQVVAVLSIKECALLQLLMKSPNKSFTTEAIVHRLWASDSSISGETVRTHVKNLRKKLGDPDGSIIRQTRGLGYCFAADHSKRQF